MTNFEHVLGVDPGINEIGWAIWKPARRRLPTCPLVAGVMKVTAGDIRSLTKAERAAALANRVIRRALKERPERLRLAVEWPEFRPGNAVGHAAAVGDDLTALAACCGALIAHAMGRGWSRTVLPVSRWKGQLSKDTVNLRLTRAIGYRDSSGKRFDTHAWDAVGIGLVAMGFELNDGAYFSRR